MPDGSVVTDISIDEGILRILNLSDTGSSLAYLGAPLYAFSGEHGVLRWAVDNKTCKDAMASEDYRCFSNSDWLDVTDEILSLKHVGYQCKCSHGFGGNPYLRYGCTSISTGKHQRESKLVILGKLFTQFLNVRPSDYMIVSQIIELPSWITAPLCLKCTPNAGVTIGLSSGGGILFLGEVFALLTRRWKRSFQKQLRKRYFHKNKGILLEQLISTDQVMAQRYSPLKS
jgi:hypothetical protein